jgi:hypothetical protein
MVSSREAIFFSVSAIPIAMLTIDFDIECETKRCPALRLY